MKKVDEGVELFDEIYDKVYTAEQQTQKEKYEIELKKEIKKLQRLRDQIKSWISGTEVKDKDGLMEYRRLIETKMEAFKIVEKETKTKTFSKEGLLRQDKVDPEEQKREETIEWMSSVIEQLQVLIDEVDLEIVKLSAGKGKKTNKSQLEDCSHHMKQHKFHMNKLEGILRLVRNESIAAETVDEVKEDLEYYIESHADDDYMMAYDEDTFYEVLGLEELDVVLVDTLTPANPALKKKDNDEKSESSGSELKNSKKAASAATIPLTIGRAQKKSVETVVLPKSNEATPTKVALSRTVSVPVPAPPLGLAPTPKQPSSPPGGGGASMAAVLKRESEERQRAQLQAAVAQAQQEQALQQQQQQQAEMMRQQQIQKQQADAQRLQLQQADALRNQLEAQQKAQQVQQVEAQQRQMAAAQLQQQQAAQQDAKQKLLQQQQQQQQQQAQNVLNTGLSTLSLGNAIGVTSNTSIASSSVSQQPFSTVSSTSSSIANNNSGKNNKDVSERYLSALNDSFLQMPTSTETDRPKSYTPRNPYPAAPTCYPTMPSPILDNPAVFEKLGVDALFFIFYYAQGTYQQYLAARELKKQSWRYHKKYMTWFQRHEEPKVTTDDYEQGTYVYFDYETGWCQRIKSDFRFEYSFLEDSLQ
jgi:CCR4-NOT transcription complex subunit 3